MTQSDNVISIDSQPVINDVLNELVVSFLIVILDDVGSMKFQLLKNFRSTLMVSTDQWKM